LSVSPVFITEELAHLSSVSIFYLLSAWVTIMAENAALFELGRGNHFLVGCKFFISLLFAFVLPPGWFLQCSQPGMVSQ